MPKTTTRSFRLSPETAASIEAIQTLDGTTATGIIETAVDVYAKRRGVSRQDVLLVAVTRLLDSVDFAGLAAERTSVASQAVRDLIEAMAWFKLDNQGGADGRTKEQIEDGAAGGQSALSRWPGASWHYDSRPVPEKG